MRLALERGPRAATLREQGLWGVVLAAGLVLARFADSSASLGPLGFRNFFPACLVHQLTGRPCPTCGMTRSFIATAHGHFERAVRFHPLGPALFVSAAVLACALILATLLRRSWRLRLSPLERAAAASVAVTAVLVLWLFRLGGGF